MVTIICIFLMCLVGMILACVGLFTKEEINEFLPPEYKASEAPLPENETRPTPTQEVIIKSLAEQYHEECEKRASEQVASDIKLCLLPQLKKLQERMAETVYLFMMDGDLRVDASDLDYNYSYELPTLLHERYYQYELCRQLNEMGFFTECDEINGIKSVTVYLNEY